MCAKYGRSRMNDVHTIGPTDSVGRPVKVVRSTALLSKKKMIFVRLLCWPSAGRLRSQHMNSFVLIKNFIYEVLVSTISIQQLLITIEYAEQISTYLFIILIRMIKMSKKGLHNN